MFNLFIFKLEGKYLCNICDNVLEYCIVIVHKNRISNITIYILLEKTHFSNISSVQSCSMILFDFDKSAIFSINIIICLDIA